MLNQYGKSKAYAFGTINKHADGVVVLVPKANSKATIALHLGTSNEAHFARSPELQKVKNNGLEPRHAPRHATLREAHTRSAGALHPASTRTAVRRIDANAAVILASTSDDETKDESPSRRLVGSGDARRGHSNARRSARLARNSGPPRLAPPLPGRRRAYLHARAAPGLQR